VSVCVSFISLKGNISVKCSPPFIARQQLGKHVPAATNTRNNRRIVGRVIFYSVRVLPKKSLWVCRCIPLSLLGNNSVKTFPRQRIIVGGVVFYAVRVVSKESRRLVIPKFIVIVNTYIIFHKIYFYVWFFKDAVSSPDYIYSVGWLGGYWVMDWSGAGRKLLWAVLRCIRVFLGGIEQNYQKAQSRWPVCGPRFVPGTSRTRRSVNHSITTFRTYFVQNV
jgi:hypothetical protein